MTTKAISKAWTFASSRIGGTPYQTLLYADGSTSCDCMCWTRRVQPNGSRSCKHTRFVDMGIADSNATAQQSYAMGEKTATVSPSGQVKPTTTILKPIRRRIKFDD